MTSKYDGSRGAATHLLKHYFRLVAERAGVQWDSDNDTEVEAIVDGIITAAVHQVAEDSARAAQARRELEALDLQDFAQQPVDATQEDGARGRRPDVSVEAMDADTVGVLLWDKAAKQDYAYVSFCAAGSMITVYAAAGLSVNVERYEDYFRRPATAATSAGAEAQPVPVSAIAYLMADIAPADEYDTAKQHEARATITAWLESLEAEEG